MTRAKEPVFAITVGVPVRDVMRLAVFFKETGRYRAAKPAGMLAYAVRFLVNLLEGGELLRGLDSFEEQMQFWGAFNYPREQLERQLMKQRVEEDREAQRAEAIEVLGRGAVALAQLRSDIRAHVEALTPEQRERLAVIAAAGQEPDFDPEAFAAKEAEKLRVEKENMKRMVAEQATAMGIVAEDAGAEEAGAKGTE